MKNVTFLLLTAFLLQANFSFAQTFQITIPHPHENEATGVAETSAGDYILVASQSSSPAAATHQLDNSLKIYKLAQNDGLILDSLEWTAPEGFGIAAVVNITEDFPVPNIFICSGSYNSTAENAKNPFMLWIDADLNIIRDTVLGLPDRREAFYQDITRENGNILWHGCIIDEEINDCNTMYQIEMTPEGEVIGEWVLDDTEGALATSRIIEMPDYFVAEDYFNGPAVFIDKTTREIAFTDEDPYNQTIPDFYALSGSPEFVKHPDTDDLFLNVGRTSWLG